MRATWRSISIRGNNSLLTDPRDHRCPNAHACQRDIPRRLFPPFRAARIEPNTTRRYD
jgi:hypothetical protein